MHFCWFYNRKALKIKKGFSEIKARITERIWLLHAPDYNEFTLKCWDKDEKDIDNSVTKTRFFSLGEATSLGEGKLWIQTC